MARTDRLGRAIRNNALWCDAVCRSHGLPGTMDDRMWSSPSRTPPYYPDAVTLSPEVEGPEVLRRIDSSDGCSVKDSWSRLELSADDFVRLVDGQWIWRDPTNASTGPGRMGPDGRRWRPVETLEDMTDWALAWGGVEDAPILGLALLTEPGVTVLAAEDEGSAFAAGCIINVTGPAGSQVAGVGNLFATDRDERRAWRGAVGAIADVVGPLPLVGWEAGESLGAAEAAGCMRLGPLTVWLR